MFSRLHQVHTRILHREVEDGQPSKFMEQHDTRAVSDGHGSPDHAHTPTAVFPEKSLAEGRRSRWADKEVFKHWFHAVSPLWSLR